MENKYYTPSIEEFHVGFECEIESSWGYVKGTYPLILKEDTLTGFTLNKLGESKTLKKVLSSIRVKYLDKEDIESLGWTDGEIYGLSGYVLNYATEDDYQMYYDEDNQFTQIYNWDAKIIFEGTIKNKSELKRLLKQLGIYEQQEN